MVKFKGKILSVKNTFIISGDDYLEYLKSSNRVSMILNLEVEFLTKRHKNSYLIKIVLSFFVLVLHF